MRNLIPLALLLATTLAGADTTITYQGQLQDGAGPHSGSVDMVFELFDAETGGSSVGSAVSAGNVAVQGGLFQVELDFGDQAYESGLYLEIEVDGETLSPRQPITAAPLAVRTLSGSGSSSIWSVSGDDIYFDDGNVAIGTDDAGGHRLRVVGAFASGDPDNNASGSESAIAGGRRNQASTLGFIGGGLDNTLVGHRGAIIGGTNNSTGSGMGVAIAGGTDNTANGSLSAIVGGRNNVTSSVRSAIVGGNDNTAIQENSFIGGGQDNTASGLNSFIAGGQENTTDGENSFAAGHGAQAVHGNTFVWADSTTANFASTDEDQFLIRAGGGVGIGTNAPEYTLDVDGTVRGSTIRSGGQGIFESTIFVGALGSGSGSEELCRVPATGRVAACSSSSLRYKENIQDFSLGWAEIRAMRPVSYRFLEGGMEDIGLIAEELVEIDERLVVLDDEGRPDSIRYGRLSVFLIAAMQEYDRYMQDRLAEVERENVELRELAERNTELEERLATLEALLLEDRQVAEQSR